MNTLTMFQQIRKNLILNAVHAKKALDQIIVNRADM